jgi:hypothetical protein
VKNFCTQDCVRKYAKKIAFGNPVRHLPASGLGQMPNFPTNLLAKRQIGIPNCRLTVCFVPLWYGVVGDGPPVPPPLPAVCFSGSPISRYFALVSQHQRRGGSVTPAKEWRLVASVGQPGAVCCDRGEVSDLAKCQLHISVMTKKRHIFLFSSWNKL